MRETVFIVHIHIFEDEVLDDEIQHPSKTSVAMYDTPLLLITQIPTSQTVLQGHRVNVNAL
jgi:hypothetical protein